MSSFGKRSAPPPAPPPEIDRALAVESRAAPDAPAPSRSADKPVPVQREVQTAPAPPRPCVKKKPEQEQRAHPRTRIFKGAIISYDEHHFTIPCTVRNISESGACLRILEKLIVPDTFVLLIELDSVEVECEVVWRQGDEIGVKFLSPVKPVKRSRAQVVTAANPYQETPLRRHPIR